MRKDIEVKVLMLNQKLQALMADIQVVTMTARKKALKSMMTIRKKLSKLTKENKK